MYIDAVLKLSNYVPKSIEKGMLFQSVMPGAFAEEGEEVLVLWATDDAGVDKDEYIAKYGLPVYPYLEDEKGEHLATYNEIGWVDIGRNDPLVPVTVDDLHLILLQLGECQVECYKESYEREGVIIPIYEDGKVVIRY